MLKYLFTIIFGAALVFYSGTLQAQVIKIATVAPEGSSWMKEMRRGAKEIKERTEGRVTIKFYGGGVMGNEKSVLRKIRIGQLQGGAFTGGGLSEVYPDICIYNLPLTFYSLEEIDYVRARMDSVLKDGLEKAGFVSFGFAEGGFANMMANIPIRTFDDLKGQRVWVPEGDAVIYAVIKALGLSPVTLPITDVLTGLQTGLLDIVSVSPIGAITFQWHTKVKYITNTPLLYLFATLIIDLRAFNSIPAEDQAVVSEVMERIYRHFNQQNRKDNLSASEALAEQGIVFIEPTNDEVKAFRKKAGAVASQMAEEGAFSKQLYDQLINYLEEFRSKKQQGTESNR